MAWPQHPWVEALAAPACLALLAVLDTGVSEHGAVQAAADRLLTATIDRAASLLRDADVRSDAGVQAALLELLGPLQGVLNDGRLRRPLFGKLPFEALRDCVLADGKVCADTEATVLAAFCYWVESTAWRRDDNEHVAAICSRIRFPAIPPPLLHNYWAQFPFLRRFDPGNHILLRAISAAAEPLLLVTWQEDTEDVVQEDAEQSESDDSESNDDDGELTAAAFKAKCSSWWQPRQPPLGGQLQPATFEVEVVKSEEGEYEDDAAVSSKHYFGGCFYEAQISKEGEGVGIFVIPRLSLQVSAAAEFKPLLLTYGVQVGYSLEVRGSGASDSVTGQGAFHPSKLIGWGISHLESGSRPIAWDEFWADGSPWLARDGVARVRFTLQAPA